jgi:hypothetical protein
MNIFLFSLIAVASAQTLTFPPVQPSYEALNIKPGKGIFLPASSLAEAVVVDGLALVNTVVPAATLAIAKGNFINVDPWIQVDYVASPFADDAYCYWPFALCVRNAASESAGYKADLSTCPGTDWGLSFDDGPTVQAAGSGLADTPALVKALDVAGLKATFFVVGVRVLANPAALIAAYESGHEIGIHTVSFSRL